MSPKAVTLVDYGMGNLRSLGRALERAGAQVTVAADPQAILRSDRLVIPGQGAFHQAMAHLLERGLLAAVRERVEGARPVLGVCLGLQLFYQSSEEAPGVPGFGLVPGPVELLPVGPGLKRPHMGWSPVEHHADHPVFAANPSGEAFYFVHSYAAHRAEGWAVAQADHGGPFVAAIAKDLRVATQFHPEKSQDAGERLLAAWLAL